MHRRKLLCQCKILLAAKNWLWLPHPPYLPEITPCDCLFPRIQSQQGGCHFQNVPEIQNTCRPCYMGLHKVSSSGAQQQWYNCWALALNRKGTALKATERPLTKTRLYFFIDSVREILDTDSKIIAKTK